MANGDVVARVGKCPISMGGAGNIGLLYALCEHIEVKTVVETGVAIRDSEYTYTDRGADEYWLTNRVPIHDEDGRVKYVVTVAYDINDRKRAEKSLRSAHVELEARVIQRTDELAQMNSLLQTVIDSLPEGVHETHHSLFDGSLEGLRVEGRPVFGVQYHPEASPGPQDSHYLFERFVGLMGGEL